MLGYVAFDGFQVVRLGGSIYLIDSLDSSYKKQSRSIFTCRIKASTTVSHASTHVHPYTLAPFHHAKSAEHPKKPTSPATTSMQPHNVCLVFTRHQPHPHVVSSNLTLKLLDAVVVLAGHKRKRHDARDVHLWAENVHVETELLAHSLDVLETFLVVGTSAADPDLDLMLDEKACNLAEGADDTLECGGDLENESQYLLGIVSVSSKNSRW
jgi:hypothetical protein